MLHSIQRRMCDIHAKHLQISSIKELLWLTLCVSANKMAVLLLALQLFECQQRSLLVAKLLC